MMTEVLSVSGNPSDKLRCPRVLITGAAGFVGRHLVRELESHGHTVFTTDTLPPDAPSAAGLPSYASGDLRSCARMREIFRYAAPDACIHLGAVSFVPDGENDPSTLLSVNVAGSRNVAEAALRETPSCRLLLVSTSQVYGPVTSVRSANVPIAENAPLLPLSMYAISKAAAEAAFSAYGAAYGLETMSARPANHTGPGQSDRFVAVSFAKQVLAFRAGKIDRIRVGNLESIRDFTDVRDVVYAYRSIIEHGQSGCAYNITTNARVRIGELLQKLQEIAGTDAPYEVDPALFRRSDASLRLDTSRLREHTGWKYRFTLEQTFSDILEWLKNEKSEHN